MSNSFRTRGVALQKFSEVVKTVFSSPSAAFDPIGASSAFNKEEVSQYYRVHVCENTATTGKKDLWMKDKAKINLKPSK